MNVTCIPFGSVEDGLQNVVRSALDREFGMDLLCRPGLPLPHETYDAKRNQYNSELLLRALLREEGSSPEMILALTNVDLFIPVLSFVFGQAQLNGTVAIVSTARLDQQFYGLQADTLLMEERLKKEVLHEVGHMMGLTHCLNTSCPMSLSTSLMLVDQKGSHLCSNCTRTLTERQRITLKW